MGMEDFQFLLSDLAVAFNENAQWKGRIVPGRFRIDPYEVPLGAIEPGLGETQIFFWCDRNQCPQPWPTLGDTLIIRKQRYDIVERNEDDLGELGFRLIRQERGIRTVTSEGIYTQPQYDFSEPDFHKGRPSRHDEIAQAFSGLDLSRPTAVVIATARRRLETNPQWRERT